MKSISYFLIALILFQSCVSAKSVTESRVDKAILDEKKVQIITIEGKTYRYKKLIRRDSILYGVKKVHGVDGLVEQDISHLNIIEVEYVFSTGVIVVMVFATMVITAIVMWFVSNPCDDPYVCPY